VAPKTASAPQPVASSSDVKVTDYGNPSGSKQQPDEVASSYPDGADDRAEGRAETSSFTDESRPSSPSPSGRPMEAEAEGPTDFSHPAAVEEQRVIWLPKDPLGLIHEIEQDLASQEILYSTGGAEMNSKGHVNVTMAPPEEIRRASMEARPLPSPDKSDGGEIQALSKNSVESKA
jgi:hypothetical protein